MTRQARADAICAGAFVLAAALFGLGRLLRSSPSREQSRQRMAGALAAAGRAVTTLDATAPVQWGEVMEIGYEHNGRRLRHAVFGVDRFDVFYEEDEVGQ